MYTTKIEMYRGGKFLRGEREVKGGRRMEVEQLVGTGSK